LDPHRASISSRVGQEEEAAQLRAQLQAAEQGGAAQGKELSTQLAAAEAERARLEAVSLERLVVESPWLQCTSKCQRF
jgi:hypothetical protein